MATRVYGICLLISGDLWDLFSDSLKKLSRCVDRVLLKSNDKPIGLYTIDSDCNNLPNSKSID